MPMMLSAFGTILCGVLCMEMLQFQNQIVSQDALVGAPVECGEDGWRDVHLLQMPEEMQVLLGSLGQLVVVVQVRSFRM